MNGCTLYTAVPMAIDAREYEANNSNQLPTMTTPLAIASSSAGRLITPGRRKPNAAQMTSKVTAPNTQRQNTTSSTGRPDASTNQPMVPEISMAATISSDPRRNELSIPHLLSSMAPVCRGPRATFQPISKAKP